MITSENGRYIRYGIFPLEEVFKNVLNKWDSIHKAVFNVDGEPIKVRMTSLRYHTFKQKGVKCVKCGIEGKFFALERDRGQISDRKASPHFNLYALSKMGNEILMTKDHIRPKSRGGSNSLKNMQTMCCVCNLKKADKIAS